MEHRPLPTSAMAKDRRLRRLFALVGSAIYENDLDPYSDEMWHVLLDVAPEFVAPDSTDEPHLMDEWRDMVNEAGGSR